MCFRVTLIRVAQREIGFPLQVQFGKMKLGDFNQCLFEDNVLCQP